MIAGERDTGPGMVFHLSPAVPDPPVKRIPDGRKRPENPVRIPLLHFQSTPVLNFLKMNPAFNRYRT
jgi:hypothetical protein